MRGRSDKSRWFALWSKEWADCVQWVHEICSMIVECGCMRNNNSSSNGMSIRPCQGVVISFWMVAAVWRTKDKSMFLMKIASGTVHVWAWFVNTCVILKCVCYRACLRKKNKSGCDSVFNSSARHVWSYCVGALDMWYLSIFSNLFWFCCIAFDVFLWTGTVDLGWMNMYNFDANWRIANLDETKAKLCSPQLCLRQLVGAGRVAVGTLRCGPQGLDHAACTGNIRPLIYT